MIKTIFLEDIKSSYFDIMENLPSDVQEEHFLDQEVDLDVIFNKDLCKLRDITKLLRYALDANDKVTVQAALVYIRVCSMRLSGFFEDIKDDADLLLKAGDWPDIPENYQVPEHYKFPHE